MEEKPPFKTKRPNPHSLSNIGLPFWVFILCIFIYMSIFSFFNISPSTLFSTTNFWFLLSNTLVIIIVVDSGAFSSFKHAHNTIIIPPHNTKSFPTNNKQEEEKRQASQSKMLQNQLQEVTMTKDGDLVITSSNYDYESHYGETWKCQDIHNITLEKKCQKNFKDEVYDGDHSCEMTKEITLEDGFQALEKEVKEETKPYGELDGHSVSENRIVLYDRALSEKYDDVEIQAQVEDNDKFSSMSNEELNRRVEEFIRRFNQQIMLQGRKDFD